MVDLFIVGFLYKIRNKDKKHAVHNDDPSVDNTMKCLYNRLFCVAK